MSAEIVFPTPRNPYTTVSVSYKVRPCDRYIRTAVLTAPITINQTDMDFGDAT